MLLLKDVLATRLRALMDQRPDLDTQTKIHKKADLSQSTVQRILAREVHTSLDIVEALARAFGITPLELLKPLQAEEQAQAIAPSYDEKQLLNSWRKLIDEDQHRVMAYMAVAAQTRTLRQDAPSRQIETDSSHKVPAPLVAANIKAMGRKPVSESKVAVTNVKERSGREKASSKG